MKFNWNEDSKFYVTGKEVTPKQFFDHDLASMKYHFAVITGGSTMEWGRLPGIRIKKKKEDDK